MEVFVKIRRWVIWAVGGCVALVLGGLIAGKLYFGSAKELEKWIGRQIVAIVNTFFVPQLSFADLEYTAPADVSMKTVALASPDGTKLLELYGFDIALAETPGMGKPIVIERVVIDRGRINLVRDENTGGLRGLSPLVKSSDVAAPIRTEGASAAATEFRLSDVLRLRLIDLRDVGVRYEPGGGRPPMQIDGITTQLKIDPGGTASEAGWYKLDFSVDRGANLHLSLRGRLNLDTRVAEVEEGRITVRVGPESLSSLPSELQAILKQHDAQGELDLRVSGRLPFSDPFAASGKLHAELRSFRLVIGARRLTIESLTMNVAMADRKVEIKSLAGRLLSGEVTADARVDLAETDMPAAVNWMIKDLDLSELRPDAPATQESVKGLVSSTGSAQAALTRVPASLTGSGDIHLRDGRLVGLPLVSALVDLMKIRVPSALSPADKADATYRFTSNGVQVERLEFITALLAARGEGIIRYDTTLDMRLNAGPVEKLESLLGKAGDLLGQLTGKLVAYKVEGRLGEPTVRLMVLEQKLGG
jgi:hypothetical protein